MADGDLCTLERVKTLGKIGATEDAKLRLLISAVSAWIVQKTGDPFVQRTVSRELSGQGSPTLYVRDRPIVDVVRVLLNGRAVPRSSGYGVAGFTWEAWDGYGPPPPPVLTYRNGVWTTGELNVLVEMIVGYDPLPEDVQHLAAECCHLLWKRDPHIDVSSQGVQQQTTTFLQRDMTAECRSILEARTIRAWG